MAPTVQEQKMQAHLDAERRRSKVAGELARLVRERGHEVVVHEAWGRFDVDEHTIATISIDQARRRSDFSWVCWLRFKINHYHDRSKHYPEPAKGWEDRKLREFADMIHDEVGVRVRHEQQEDERAERKRQMEQTAKEINERIGAHPYEEGWVSVTPSRTYHVKLPTLSEGEIALLASFARALTGLRSNPDIDQSRVGEAHVYLVLEDEARPTAKVVNLFLDGATRDDDPIVLTAKPEEP